ncbi:MAG TPA: bifunctional (p)ppGpp synthetase/guanosine-3',5'-bis(diphosphate) 3'-pyrophosphohydrolase [Bacteroidia bacterium]|jgi:guanosine-3',5'-bis(diphosphate) 3'-pyrophosphohydrolase|nr:bifunctional (p)ppGpp synthetase/guanosine-3',5'-bis(diphosphate) 3'-pyrophosphohydrolase [Bacteroidia bacterium]
MEHKRNDQLEKKEILNRYKNLLQASRRRMEKGDKALIRKAFEMAVEAHKDMRRKSGEPYIYHPIAVAQICAEEIGLGTTSIVCALLHDTVEDTDITIEDIKGMFGERIAKIIDGLTKISGVFDQTSSLQAENFRKMLLTLSDDIRVILIKLADRLHNMRTLESMARDKQMKIASETLYLYGPLAHRLGLNAIKSELEDLGLKYTHSDAYDDIAEKLKESEPERKKFIAKFIEPLKDILKEQDFKFKIFGRPKSIFSIYNKIKHKGVSFEEIYDLFAIRIIINSKPEEEKADCWKIYSIITDFYHPSPERLRDWISTPKANGYESLHTTVMGPEGKWVEVQIRTDRMDEIAEKGYAAHWKYKDTASEKESQLEEWIGKIREMLESPEENALDFIDDFKLNLFAEEIFVFTPKGEMRTIPSGATALDFAFDIHTKIGEHCIGAKVNHKLVPLSYELKSGDQVELLTSKKQNPNEDWLKFVITAKAKSKIKNALKEQRKKTASEGREILERKFYRHKLEFTIQNIKEFAGFLKLPSTQEVFYRTAKEAIGSPEIKEYVNFKKHPEKYVNKKLEQQHTIEELVNTKRGKSDWLVIGDDMEKLDYKLSPCCNPIPGDDVFGFITVGEGIKIHRVNCPNAVKLLSNYAYRVVKAKWNSQQLLTFLASIKIKGTDALGIVNNITKIISTQHNVNMRSITFDTEDGIFEGTVMVYVHSTEHLTQLSNNLKKVPGVISVQRIDGEKHKAN